MKKGNKKNVDDLLALAKKSKVQSITKKAPSSKPKSNGKVIRYEHNDTDKWLVSEVKKLANSHDITLNDIYELVNQVKKDDKKQKSGYNVFYSIKKDQCQDSRFLLWCLICGVKPKITYEPFDYDKFPELKKEIILNGVKDRNDSNKNKK